MDDFIPQKGHYRSLLVYQIAEIIYDITYIFVNRFLLRGDRTFDQMLQAALLVNRTLQKEVLRVVPQRRLR